METLLQLCEAGGRANRKGPGRGGGCQGGWLPEVPQAGHRESAVRGKVWVRLPLLLPSLCAVPLRDPDCCPCPLVKPGLMPSPLPGLGRVEKEAVRPAGHGAPITRHWAVLSCLRGGCNHCLHFVDEGNRGSERLSVYLRPAKPHREAVVGASQVQNSRLALSHGAPLGGTVIPAIHPCVTDRVSMEWPERVQKGRWCRSLDWPAGWGLLPTVGRCRETWL